MKKLLSIILCFALLLGLLAGCGQTQKENASTEPAAKPAVDDVKSEEPAKLKFVMYGDPGDRNTEFFAKEFHDKVLEDLNLDVTVDYVAWGAVDQIATMIASGEKFAFMSHLTNANTLSWPQKGYYATIDEAMIREVAPTYVKLRENYGYGFDAVKYQGNVIALPQGAFPFGGQQDGLAIRNDILNAVGLDYTEIKTYDDLMNAFAAVHEKYPDMRILGNISAISRTLCPAYAPGQVLKGTLYQIVDVDESKPDDDTVISRFESEEFETLCKMLEEMYALGYTQIDNVTDKDGAPKVDWSTGNALCFFGNPTYLYDHDEPGYDQGEDVQLLYLEDAVPVILKDYDWAWSVSVGAQDQVEDYLRFFEWMYATPENYRFCLYGIEGKDWEWDTDGDVKTLIGDLFFYEWQHKVGDYHVMSNMFDAEDVKVYNNFDANSIYSKTIGFTFDVSPVSTEAALIDAIISEKVMPIAGGMGNFDEDWPAILAELKEAGLDAYVAEYQRQFTEFMANK